MTGFADLRSFLNRLRRDGDLVEITAPVDANQEAAEIHRRGDPRRARGAPVQQCPWRALSAGHQPVRDAASRRPGLRDATAPAHRAAGPHRRDDPAADAGQAVARPRPARRPGARRPVAQGRRAGGPSPHRRRAPRRAAGDHELAGGRRPVHHAAAGLYRAARSPGPQPRHGTGCTSTIAAAPGCTSRSARAAASTTRSPRRAGSTCRSPCSSAARRR